jgi:hypothetical protein
MAVRRQSSYTSVVQPDFRESNSVIDEHLTPPYALVCERLQSQPCYRSLLLRESKSQVIQLQGERSVATSIKEPNNVVRHFTYELSEESTAKWRATSASSASRKSADEQFLGFSKGSILERLKSNDASLKSLDLEGVDIGEDRTGHLLRVLVNNTCLNELKLGGTPVTTALAPHISQMLVATALLQRLCLFRSKMGDEALAHLMQGLRVNRSLLFLNLGANDISSTGAAHLAHVLLVNTRLTSLKLHGNHIGDAGASALVDACCVNSTLTSLHCGYNNISSSAAIKFAQMSEHNSSLQHLHVGRVFGGDEESKVALARALLRWPMLGSSFTETVKPAKYR